jgi:hypothetical protein
MNCLECPVYWRDKVDQSACDQCVKKRNGNKEKEDRK